MGYEGIDVRTMAGNMVRLQLPDTTSVASDVADIVTTTGVIKINNGDETVFTNADIKSGAYLGYDSSTQKCLVELKLNKDAKAKLAEITSSGSYKLTVTVDSSVITAEVSGTEHIKNGKLNVSFSTSDYSKALKLAYCAQTGNINAKLSGESDYSYMIEGTAGDNALMVFALAALTVFVVGCVYLVAANKLMGVAALLTSLLGVIALDFFGATFTWLVVDGAAVAAFGFGIILILAAAMIILYQIKSQYALGKSLRDAIDNGFAYGRKAVLELMLIAVVSGIALWICGGAAKSFGIVLFGSSAIAILCALLLKSVINMIVGMGIENTKVLGLKRGE